MTKWKHTLEERVQAVRERLEGGKIFSEISKTYGTTAQVVRNWVKRYHEMGVSGLEDRRGKRLASQTPRTPEEALRICHSLCVRSTIKYTRHSCTRWASGPQCLAGNVLNRQFYADKPNEKWLTDVTQLKYYACYVSVPHFQHLQKPA